MNYLNQNEKNVIYWIGSHMGNKMVAWPSNEELARLLSKSVKTVQRAVKSLEAKNILIVERHHRQNNVYKFNPNWLSIFDTLDIKLGKLGRQNDSLGRQIVHSRATQCRTNNINNNIINNSKSYPQIKDMTTYEPENTSNKGSPLYEKFAKH